MPKNTILIYDVVTLPKGCTIDHVVNLFNSEGIVLWNSSIGGVEPLIITYSDNGQEATFYKTEEEKDEE